jgi:hypothetical protein
MSAPRYGFQSAIDVRYMQNQLWRLTHPVRYLSALTQKAYTVEAGYQWNGASVPGFSLTGIADRHSAFPATLIHDYLVDHPDIEPPDVADDLFAEIMAGMFHASTFYTGELEPNWRRWIMRQAVRFGSHHFVNAQGLGFQPPIGD